MSRRSPHRIRTIKPEFFADARVRNWDDAARVAFIALWTWADDFGRFVWDHAQLAGFIWPGELARDAAATMDKTARVLAFLAAERRIRRYEVAGEPYGLIVRFKAHQSITTPRQLCPAPTVDHPVQSEGKLLGAPLAAVPASLIDRCFGRLKGDDQIAETQPSIRSSDPPAPRQYPSDDGMVDDRLTHGCETVADRNAESPAKTPSLDAATEASSNGSAQESEGDGMGYNRLAFPLPPSAKGHPGIVAARFAVDVLKSQGKIRIDVTGHPSAAAREAAVSPRARGRVRSDLGSRIDPDPSPPPPSPSKARSNTMSEFTDQDFEVELSKHRDPTGRYYTAQGILLILARHWSGHLDSVTTKVFRYARGIAEQFTMIEVDAFRRSPAIALIYSPWGLATGLTRARTAGHLSAADSRAAFARLQAEEAAGRMLADPAAILAALADLRAAGQKPPRAVAKLWRRVLEEAGSVIPEDL